MKKEIADRWVVALRSGQYEQTSGALHRTDTASGDAFCCLGVLCDLAAKAGAVKRSYDDERDDGKMYYDHEEGVAPKRVQEWAGLQSDGGTLVNATHRPKLFELNDDHGWDFARIADHIEENWEHL